LGSSTRTQVAVDRNTIARGPQHRTSSLSTVVFGSMSLRLDPAASQAAV